MPAKPATLVKAKKPTPATVDGEPLDRSLDRALPPRVTGHTPAPRLVRALKSFEQEVGGRGTLVSEIVGAASQLSPREALALQLLADPAHDRRPLSDILGSVGLSVAAFLRLFREARGARAYLEALDKVWAKLPDVAMDVMSRALPMEKPCPRCDLAGTLPLAGKGHGESRGSQDPDRREDQRVLCSTCSGRGVITVEPTLDYAKLALQIGGLLKKTPTIQVDQSKNLQQNFLSIGDTLRSHIAATNRVLYGRDGQQGQLGQEVQEGEEIQAEEVQASQEGQEDVEDQG
jgi:hypothetical protein